MLNIVHLEHRSDRYETLMKELSQQQIKYYKIWPGISNDLYPPFGGIGKAHKQIIQEAKRKNFTSTLIAQDDIKFTAKGAYQYFMENIPYDFDIYLGSIYYGKIKSDNTVNDFAGLTLFLVHERFYETFLSLPENQHLDRSLKGKGKFVVCHPFVATQYNGYSDNRKAYCNNDNFLRRRTLFKGP